MSKRHKHHREVNKEKQSNPPVKSLKTEGSFGDKLTMALDQMLDKAEEKKAPPVLPTIQLPEKFVLPTAAEEQKTTPDTAAEPDDGISKALDQLIPEDLPDELPERKSDSELPKLELPHIAPLQDKVPQTGVQYTERDFSDDLLRSLPDTPKAQAEPIQEPFSFVLQYPAEKQTKEAAITMPELTEAEIPLPQLQEEDSALPPEPEDLALELPEVPKTAFLLTEEQPTLETELFDLTEAEYLFEDSETALAEAERAPIELQFLRAVQAPENEASLMELLPIETEQAPEEEAAPEQERFLQAVQAPRDEAALIELSSIETEQATDEEAGPIDEQFLQAVQAPKEEDLSSLLQSVRSILGSDAPQPKQPVEKNPEPKTELPLSASGDTVRFSPIPKIENLTKTEARQESNHAQHRSDTASSEPAAQPKETELPKPAAQPKETEHPKPAAQPKETELPKPATQPKETELPKPAAQPKETELPKPAAQPKETEPPKPAEQPREDIAATAAEQSAVTEKPFSSAEPSSDDFWSELDALKNLLGEETSTQKQSLPEAEQVKPESAEQPKADEHQTNHQTKRYASAEQPQQAVPRRDKKRNKKKTEALSKDDQPLQISAAEVAALTQQAEAQVELTTAPSAAAPEAPSVKPQSEAVLPQKEKHEPVQAHADKPKKKHSTSQTQPKAQSDPAPTARRPAAHSTAAAAAAEAVSVQPAGAIIERLTQTEAKTERKDTPPAAPKKQNTAAPDKVPYAARKKAEGKAARRRAQKPEQEGLHPEEAYKRYMQRLGTVGTRLAAAAAVCVLSVFFTAYGALGWSFLPYGTGKAVTAYILLALMCITALLAGDIFKEAVQKLKTMQFAAPLMVGLATIATAFDTFFAAAADRVPFCTAASILIFLLLWDKHDGIVGMLTTLRVLRDAKEPAGVVEVHDVMKGSVGLARTKGSVRDFMDKYEQTPPTEKLMQIYVPLMVVICVIASAVIAAKSGGSYTWGLSLMLLGSIPLVGILNFSRLFCILAKRLSDSDAVLCGWYGAKTFGGDHAVMVGDNDLFPEGQIKLNGIKVLADNADKVIGYAAAAAEATGNALYPLFEDELQSRNARHYHADRSRFYEHGGIGAEINGDIVLLGTLDFMKRMGVHMKGGMKLRQAVYTSVNGELAAVFAIKYTPRDSVRRGLAAITSNRHFKTVLVTRDFLLTPELIRDKYEISLTNTVYPSTQERIRLSEAELKNKGKQGALMLNDSFSCFAEAAAGGRVLKTAVTLSMLLALLNGIAGLILMTVLAVQNGTDAATAANLLLYQLAWMLPTLLVTGLTRRF